MNKKEKVKVLLDKYKAGICSEIELKQLLQLMKEDPGLYNLLDETVNHDWWEQTLQAEKEVTDPKVIRRKPRINRLRYWAAAASVLLLIAAGVTWWLNVNTGVITYSTAYGERQQIELPDGSQVELNANSQLTWNKNWKRSGIRSVVLDGEAYFDVVRREGKQFQVSADETIVKVLGTSFNVSNRRGDTEVFLEEGKVRLEVPDLPILTMAPGEKVQYDTQEKKIKKTQQETLHSAASWKTGVISFQKTPLEEIIPELGDIYGIELICTDDFLNQKLMDVGVPYMDWEATKSSLELAMNVEINEMDGKYYIESESKE